MATIVGMITVSYLVGTGNRQYSDYHHNASSHAENASAQRILQRDFRAIATDFRERIVRAIDTTLAR